MEINKKDFNFYKSLGLKALREILTHRGFVEVISTKCFLEEKYRGKNLSQPQIAKIVKYICSIDSFKGSEALIRERLKTSKYAGILTKEFLEQKYLVEKLSTTQIAKIVKCTSQLIFYYLKKYNIPRRTISEANKGMKLSEETRQKMSEANQGKNNPMYGKHHSRETRKKLSETRKRLGLSKGENNPMYGVHRWGEESSNWGGGKCKDSSGYILILSPNHPHKSSGNHVREHRLVMERFLGQYLESGWVVHHINGIKDDNRIENLICFASNSAHRRYHKDPKLVKSEEIIFVPIWKTIS